MARSYPSVQFKSLAVLLSNSVVGIKNHIAYSGQEMKGPDTVQLCINLGSDYLNDVIRLIECLEFRLRYGNPPIIWGRIRELCFEQLEVSVPELLESTCALRDDLVEQPARVFRKGRPGRQKVWSDLYTRHDDCLRNLGKVESLDLTLFDTDESLMRLEQNWDVERNCER